MEMESQDLLDSLALEFAAKAAKGIEDDPILNTVLKYRRVKRSTFFKLIIFSHPKFKEIVS